MNIYRAFLVFLIVSPLYMSNTQSQWMLTNGPLGGAVRCFAFSDTNLYAGTESGGISVTTDHGTKWTSINTGLTNTNVRSLVISTDGDIIFAGTSGGGVFGSSNNGSGSTWMSRNTGLTNLSIFSLTANQSYTFAGTGNGVFRANATATSWTLVNSGLPNNIVVHSLVFIGDTLFAGTDNGIYRSSNDGTSWTTINTGLTNLTVYTLAVMGTYIFAGTGGGGVFLSINKGENWFDINTGLSNPNIRTLFTTGEYIIAGASSISPPPGVFLSKNNGTSWDSANTGLNPNAHIWSLIVRDEFIFAGTNGNGVWRRGFPVMSANIEDAKIPASLILGQNYPNPFNPSTTIRYAIPQRSHIILKIFNSLGKEIATLVDEQKDAGQYKIEWKPNLPSGVYFYRLQADTFVETKKLVLLK